MAATIFTAVDTAPRMISREIRGVIKDAPTPFWTIRSVGTLASAIPGSVYTVIRPSTTITIISAFTTTPAPMLFAASAGFSKDRACWTNTAMFDNWNVPYRNAEYKALPTGSSAAVICSAASVIFPIPAAILGI